MQSIRRRVVAAPGPAEVDAKVDARRTICAFDSAISGVSTVSDQSPPTPALVASRAMASNAAMKSGRQSG